MPASLVVLGLAEGEGDVAVFDHVLDLSSHWVLQLYVSLVRGGDENATGCAKTYSSEKTR